MRTFPLIAIACCIWITTALAEEADFSRLASSERAQLAKCFADMLTVVKRHNLRKHLLPLLEAGCAAEMRSYKAALLPHWANEFAPVIVRSLFEKTSQRNEEFESVGAGKYQ